MPWQLALLLRRFPLHDPWRGELGRYLDRHGIEFDPRYLWA